MTTNAQHAIQLDVRIQALKSEYRAQLEQLIAKRESATAEELRGHMWRAHCAAVDFFNAVEKSIPAGAVLGADLKDAWYTDRAETAVGVLHTIADHYETLWGMCTKAGIERTQYSASSTAYANMQRLAMAVRPLLTVSIRARFASCGLPTVGFDMPEASKPAKWEKIAGFVFGVVILLLLLLLALFIREPTPWQVFVFRTALALAAAGIASILSGFLNVRIKNIIRAGAGLGVFVVVYMLNPPQLILDVKQGTPAKSSPTTAPAGTTPNGTP